MLVRFLYAAVLLTVLGAFPRNAAVRPHGGRAPAPAASAESPAWEPRPTPERYCAAEGALEFGGEADFAIPRIDR